MNFGDFEQFFRDRETPSMSHEPTMAPTIAPTAAAGERKLSLNRDKSLEDSWTGGHGIYDRFYAYAAAYTARKATTTTSNEGVQRGGSLRVRKTAICGPDYISAGRRMFLPNIPWF